MTLRTIGASAAAGFGIVLAGALPAPYAAAAANTACSTSDGISGCTTRVSVTHTGGDPNGTSTRNSVSADGTVVVFQSNADNLVANDRRSHGTDVFWAKRSNPAGTIRRVSVSAATGGDANGDSTFNAVDASGRYVAFFSLATDLVPGHTTRRGDVYVRDMSKPQGAPGSVVEVGVRPDGRPGNGSSSRPTISGDGRYVVFNSNATDLVPGAAHHGDVYIRDLRSGVTKRLSVAAGGGNPNGTSDRAQISTDGRRVAFQSLASNLTARDTNGKADVFYVNNPFVAALNTRLVSVGTNGTSGRGPSQRPAISGNGTYVAWESTASNLVAGDTNGKYDIFVRNMATSRTTRVSVSYDGSQLTGASTRPSLNGDGSVVGFAGNSHNIVRGDHNSSRDVFLRRNWASARGYNVRVSVSASGGDGMGCSGRTTAAQGAAPNGAAGAPDLSSRPSLSSSGRVVSFISGFCNLVPGDNNGKVSLDDVFVRAFSS